MQTIPAVRGRIAPPLKGVPWQGGAHRVRINCSHCGVSFERYASAVRSRNFCSNRCRFSRMGGEENPKWRGGLVTVICVQCGISFGAKQDQLAVGKAKFCSKNCKHASQQGPKPERRKPLVPCGFCGQPFRRIIGTRESCCSKACSGRLRAKYPSHAEARRASDLRRRSRERESILLGQHTEAQWRDLCARHKRRCAICKKQKILTRDHILPLRLGGGDEITNIQPLCRECNSRKGAQRVLLL